MAVFKEKDKKTWEVFFYYKNYQGEKRRKHKRGFITKKEAQEWEREFLAKIEFNTEMSFQSLYELYFEDLASRIRITTLKAKKITFETKILPFFSKLSLEDITPAKVRAWQNKLLNEVTRTGNLPAPTYLKYINNQLTAIFNYAVKYHDMRCNPCHRAGTIGKKNGEEMEIWEVDEFEKFIETLKHKPISYTGFNILFWTGMRIGELLALNVGDIDLNKKIININKSYQRLSGEDVITLPKTPKSKRKIFISDELVEIIENYISTLYKPKKTTRLFECTKYRFEHDMKNYSKKAGVKRIRLHDLRHSHASYLFHHGIDALTISKRLGHEKLQTTLDTYTHLYQSAGDKLLNILNRKKEEL